MNELFDIRPEVAEALRAGGPVVALETTVIAHGLPYPRNLEAAQAMEAAVRRAGAVPAAIGLSGGRVRIGLEAALLERFARSGEAVKTSSRDLGVVLAAGHDGATTVAATVCLAARAGIAVFATGGIGGVHRDAAASGDVSADLTELSRNDIAVVSAGAKAILDLPRTLEALETLGVPVIGYRTGRLPAFYCRDSGLALEARVETAREAAAVLRAHRGLGLGGGLLFVNPPPASAALDPAEMDAHLATALSEARAKGVAGKAVTPFLLARLAELTGGRSLVANMALLEDNARVAAEIAVAAASPQRDQ